MKLRLILLTSLLVLLPASYSFGQAVFTEFSGTEMGAPIPPDFSKTTVSCPGGQPTGVIIPAPCTPGSRVHFRNAVFFYIAQTNNALVSGFEEVTMNGNFDGWRPDLMGPGSGQMWGTLVFKVKDAAGKETGEIWEGTWTGTRTVTGSVAQSEIEAVAHGKGGRIEGLKAKWEVTLDPTAGVGVIEGRILAPPGKTR